ncbi:uncharacterized protein K452DRAFT_317492 [Aplosporella prunicola CBS 121167]|uniref:Uncharacterized protein n=1 Tax=Aplosporella prunicola CBS 121167 TaxID=1176127 RepID=A0A6A6BH71_9PEZI|nr:uncharacterized protein K452DRAFT_317492 [Aplosporella prunicola CBS 121167]KAF2143326.1 hypothetical protein K452DRAFT_317492 [Aplosporella prunicola CBS 121167]
MFLAGASANRHRRQQSRGTGGPPGPLGSLLTNRRLQDALGQHEDLLSLYDQVEQQLPGAPRLLPRHFDPMRVALWIQQTGLEEVNDADSAELLRQMNCDRAVAIMSDKKSGSADDDGDDDDDDDEEEEEEEEDGDDAEDLNIGGDDDDGNDDDNGNDNGNDERGCGEKKGKALSGDDGDDDEEDQKEQEEQEGEGDDDDVDLDTKVTNKIHSIIAEIDHLFPEAAIETNF